MRVGGIGAKIDGTIEFGLAAPTAIRSARLVPTLAMASRPAPAVDTLCRAQRATLPLLSTDPTICCVAVRSAGTGDDRAGKL